jgi:multiple sugar transport system permease protein
MASAAFSSAVITRARFAWNIASKWCWALLFAYCFGMVGYHMLIFSSGIEKIPAEYFEASTIDGAGRPRQFAHITWPLLRGVLKTNITMWTITSAGFFIWSRLFSTVTASNQTITPMVYMYLQTFGAGNVVTERNAGLGAAVGVVMAVFVVAAFLITNFLIKKDEYEY